MIKAKELLALMGVFEKLSLTYKIFLTLLYFVHRDACQKHMHGNINLLDFKVKYKNHAQKDHH